MLSREEKYIQEFETILQTGRIHDSEENSAYKISEKQLKKLFKGYKRTYKQLNKIIRISDRQQDELNLKSQKVKSLLDNADQGFLSFGLDCIIDDEYSLECVKLLGDGLSGKNIADILYPADPKANLFFKDTLINVSNEQSDMIKDVMLSLLPEELILNRRAIKIDYKIINSQKFMLVLTNITKEKILERKIRQEQEILKMIVTIVSDPTQFYELKDDFLSFSANKLSFVNNNLSFATNLSEVYRDIHTFKGSFAQIRMQGCVKKLHVLETTLSGLKIGGEHDNSELTQILEQSDFDLWIEKDLNIIQKILGVEFFDKQHKLTVDDQFMVNIEDKITHLLHSDNKHVTTYENILSEINKAKGTTINKALSGYPKLCVESAEGLKKNIFDFKVSGGEEILMPLHFKPFFKSLIHVFRNAIDHGIEDLETRLLAGKNELGLISCHVEDHSEYIKVIISDDGAGIDTETLKQKALSANIISPEKLSALSKKDVLNLIFHEGLSTNDIVNELSGRGIGMNAVKAEIEKLSGNIDVESHPGKGTTVSFKIPIAIYGNLINIASNRQDNITIEYILSPIVNRVTTFLQSDMNINLHKKAKFTYTSIDRIIFKKFTSYIHISGLVEVSICMSYDLFLLDEILEEFNQGDPIDPEELPAYRESVSMEVLNIIVGNALFNPYDKTILEITSPFITDYDELCSRGINEKIAHVIIDTEFGEMQVLVGRF
jgi:two-component system, chemotaxis family, sensor kinase CheA